MVVEAMWCEQCQRLLIIVVGDEAGKEEPNVGFYKKRETGFCWVGVCSDMGPFGFTQNQKQTKATHSMDLERKCVTFSQKTQIPFTALLFKLQFLSFLNKYALM